MKHFPGLKSARNIERQLTAPATKTRPVRLKANSQEELANKSNKTAQKSPPQVSCFFGSFLYSLIKK
jgi:hypothetical protein